MKITELQRPGIYRRMIRIVGRAGEVRADMEDDSHRFGIVLHHDGLVVKSVQGIPLRTPWTLCRDAAALLPELLGMPLSGDVLTAGGVTDPKQQCTHLFDLASLAVAHAARGTRTREYLIEAPWYTLHGPRTMSLHRDGELIWTWTLQGTRIIAPEPFAGLDSRELLTWGKSTLPGQDPFEALFIMRRAVLISGSRLLDLDSLSNPAATGHGLGACYVHQPLRVELARRNIGSTRDFTDRPHVLLADLDTHGDI